MLAIGVMFMVLLLGGEDGQLSRIAGTDGSAEFDAASPAMQPSAQEPPPPSTDTVSSAEWGEDGSGDFGGVDEDLVDSAAGFDPSPDDAGAGEAPAPEGYEMQAPTPDIEPVPVFEPQETESFDQGGS